MNIILGKIDKKNLTENVLYDLRNSFDCQLQANGKGEYEGYHLCMDKKSCELMKKQEPINDALILFISPEVFKLIY